MGKRKKIFSWLFRILLVFIFLAGIIAVFTPSLLNLEMVKKTIGEKISKDVGGQLTYRKLKLSYFPRPNVSIQTAKISIPDSFTIDIRWMRLYPKILPLLQGKFEIALVTIGYADYAMQLPPIKNATTKSREQMPSADEIVKGFLNGVRKLPEFKLPEGNLRIKNGRVNLTDPYGRVFKLRDLQAAYVDHDDLLDFSIKCKANLWEQIDISGSIDPADFKGVAHVRLSKFRPQTLVAYLIPDSSVQISDTKANLSIDITSDGLGNIRAEVQGAIPNIELIYQKERLIIKDSRIKGKLEVNEKRFRATLSQLVLAEPKANLRGAFVYDEKQQQIQLTLAGSQIDAKSVRLAALKLASASKTIEVLFDIIRAGDVPWMTVELRGKTIADFRNLDNLTIKGRMNRGQIYIPGVKLNLEEVFGDAEIYNGILHGRNLKARFGKSRGHNGKIILGLNDNLEPFRLNIGINADVSQIPPVLRRVVPNKNFLRELDQITDVTGTAAGTLILEDKLSNLGARVEVSDAMLSARYNRLPFPISLKGGRFVYEKSWITMQNFSADIGRSSLSEFSTSIDWVKAPKFKADVNSAKIDLQQLYSWLSSFSAIKRRFAGLSSLKGSVTIDTSKIEGPLLNPQNWKVQTKGIINQVVLATSKLPKDVIIKRGRFSWQQARIEFAGINAAMGKSSLTDLSGMAVWKKRWMIQARTEGAIFDPEDISTLVFSDKKLARSLNPILPLSGKLNFKNMAYRGPLSGTSRQPPDISADINRITFDSGGLPGTFQIDRGQLNWHQNRFMLENIDAKLGNSQISQFSATFDLGRHKSFNLSCRSAKLLPGEIQPFLASFEELRPRINTIAATEGTLALSGVDLKGPLHAPREWDWNLTADAQNLAVEHDALTDHLKINEGTLLVTTERPGQIAHHTIKIQTMDLHWGDNHLSLKGMMDLSAREVLTKLNVDADSLDWDQIKTLLDYMAKKRAQAVGRHGSDRMLGTIEVKSAGFKWDSYIVRPLEADITFQPDEILVTVNRADFCGISIRGLLNFTDQVLDLYLVPTAVNAKLVSTLSCLVAKNELATGTYNLNGEILAKAKPQAISRSLTGTLAFSAEEGRIYRFGLLAKILAILNVTEIYRGEIPDLTGEGFAYRGMTARARLQGGKMIMEECSIDGVSMGIACEGDIDFIDKQIDLLILVAPFKTVDRIVEILPLIGNVLGGKLISIPFKAKGDLSDPEVFPLPPTAVGSGILGILERTLKLPITIIQPVISTMKDDTQSPSSITEDSSR